MSELCKVKLILFGSVALNLSKLKSVEKNKKTVSHSYLFSFRISIVQNESRNK